MPWEDESSFNHVKVKSKGKKSGKENVASDAVPNENVNVKENLSDVRGDNFDFKPPKRVVGMCKYMVNCALEPSASQFDPLKKYSLVLM